MKNVKNISKTKAVKLINNKNYFSKGYKNFFGSQLIKNIIFGDIDETFVGIYEDRIIEVSDVESIKRQMLKIILNNGKIYHVENITEKEVNTVKSLLNKINNISETLDLNVMYIEAEEFIDKLSQAVFFNGIKTLAEEAKKNGQI